MKYVYVLTSSENDYYYEQFFISVTSLRLHNPNAFIVVLIDSKTKQSLTGKRSGFEQIVSETIIITTPPEFSQKEVSRWIKTSINKYVSGDFLYIDCDTVIAGDLCCDFLPENIGAILDTHVSLEKHYLCPFFNEQDKRAGFISSFETGKRFNGGVIFYRDSPAANDLFLRWHSLWLLSKEKGVHQDMPALNQANYEMPGIITEMPGEWNCQITHNGLPFLADARIIHCFATSIKLYDCPFLPASIPILASVKESGNISAELKELLKNPKAAFETNSRIISGKNELEVINSKLFSFLLFLKKNMPCLFKSINSFILKTRAKTQK